MPILSCTRPTFENLNMLRTILTFTPTYKLHLFSIRLAVVRGVIPLLAFSTRAANQVSNSSKAKTAVVVNNSAPATAGLNNRIKSLIEKRLKVIQKTPTANKRSTNSSKKGEAARNTNLDLKIAGLVVRVDDAIATVLGLKQASVGSVVHFLETNVSGIVLSIERKGLIKVSLFGYKARVNETVTLKNNSFVVKCSRSKKGHVVDIFGNIIDGSAGAKFSNGLSLLSSRSKQLDLDTMVKSHLASGSFAAYNSLYYNDFEKIADVSAPSIMNRSKVSDPLYTGTTVIDILLPIGKGQRQLIIGDRQTGKTTLAVDMIINQSNLTRDFGYFGNCEVTSVYVSIGQRRSEVYSIYKTLKFLNAAFSSVIVTSSASEPCTLQYLAAYAGCTLGEFFRDAGQNAVVIYDDLSKHAVAYRQMCLLLRRSPGRDAYPSDIFYVHSRLLERAASTREGTLTALPVVETQANDVSAYIPTNVISITDGQIFLESSLFSKGIKPAINIGLSVSRIGAAAQNVVFKKIAPSLRKQLASYRVFEIFKSFSDDISDAIKNILSRGAVLAEITKQNPNEPLNFNVQALLVYAGTSGLLDSLSSNDLPALKELVFDDSSAGRLKSVFFDQMLNNKPLNDNSPFDVSYYVDLAITSVRYIASCNSSTAQ